ncbi:SidA/IucD/PvdA family monooxygenase [Solihabitans fulvus]|uniref:SidA/IucD/PvdA family monooxygenase n=1 Tax=Solihabitans fulvus TaxID=1892852 RepID=A0A5B2XWG4_9PSEU|nr:NAD(P)-binding domain-containing protein [Solihabitans fulvus]KAA2267041.1 SidA/IucD/PvdA family monooxygenase [Solihabitans fulvus]
MPANTVPLVIIGAGPYGLALSAQCKHLGVEHVVFGSPMSLWRDHMPRGMVLRSHADWHLDPLEEYTLERYAVESGLDRSEPDPIPLSHYLAYAEWFQQRRGLTADRREVTRLDAAGSGFAVTLDDDSVVDADQVVVATGLGACPHVPDELAAALPEGRYSHSGDRVDLATFTGRSCLIVGGRQSAFEWAALAAEHGAAEVHVSHRHPTPVFAPADWSWVTPLLERFDSDPAWYRTMAPDEQDAITERMWRIGRLQLEAWLAPRIDRPEVRLWPNSQIRSCHEDPEGGLLVALDTGRSLAVDHVLLATGYRMDVARLGFLASGSALAGVRVDGGFPVLDEHFQSTVPGLYFTNKFAVRDFGHFFDFTAAARVSARIIADHVRLGLPATSR